MFTGIVEELGEILVREHEGDSARLTVRGPLVTSDAGHGDSINVNGVCLTVVDLPGGDTFTADVMRETLDRSSLGSLTVGGVVNLERSVPADGRLGGHIVQGHIDGTGTVRSRTVHEYWEVVRIGLAPELAKYVAEKGSIAVDGISLTVSAVSDPAEPEPWFEVSLIPTTMETTTLGAAREGSVVNLEVDCLAKYLERLGAFGR